MIPRIFVSSTYYDLRYVRERLEKFIQSYGFEAVLFESDKVTYQHNKEIDQSAYYEVELCHLMILIVGGRYGSPSTLANVEEERKKYDEEFISITRTEFETAIKKKIPILVFIDKNVYSEYQTYLENQDFFDRSYDSITNERGGKRKFKFAHVDHINVFRFIDIAKTKAVKTFDKVEEIESYIKSQLAGMFYLYLESLKRKADENKILDTVSELNNVTLRMNEMVTSVGKEILGKDKKEYERVIDSQLSIMLDFFVDQFSTNIEFEHEYDPLELEAINTKEIATIIFNSTINVELPSPPKDVGLSERFKFGRAITAQTLVKLKQQLEQIDSNLVIKQYNFRKLNRVFIERVKPFIRNQKDESLLIDMIQKSIAAKLSELPF